MNYKETISLIFQIILNNLPTNDNLDINKLKEAQKSENIVNYPNTIVIPFNKESYQCNLVIGNIANHDYKRIGNVIQSSHSIEVKIQYPEYIRPPNVDMLKFFIEVSEIAAKINKEVKGKKLLKETVCANIIPENN